MDFTFRLIVIITVIIAKIAVTMYWKTNTEKS